MGSWKTNGYGVEKAGQVIKIGDKIVYDRKSAPG